MMAISPRSVRARRAQLAPPPDLYFRAALSELALARRLFQLRILGPRAMSLALRLADLLTRMGMASWRRKRRRLIGGGAGKGG